MTNWSQEKNRNKKNKGWSLNIKIINSTNY